MLPENIDDEMMKMDGFDDCIIGTAERYGMPTVIAYDKEKVLDKLIDGGMSIEEAEEFFDKAYKLYSLFWAINLKLVDVGEIKKIGDDALNRHDEKGQVHSAKFNELLEKLLDCCGE